MSVNVSPRWDIRGCRNLWAMLYLNVPKFEEKSIFPTTTTKFKDRSSLNVGRVLKHLEPSITPPILATPLAESWSSMATFFDGSMEY